jgi:hypothetical protein
MSSRKTRFASFVVPLALALVAVETRPVSLKDLLLGL